MSKPLMHYTLLAAEGQPAEVEKFSQIADLALSLNLAVALNRADKPRRAVLDCAKIAGRRLSNEQVQNVVKRIRNPILTPDPVGFATAFLRSIREADSEIRRRMIQDGVISAFE